MSLNADGSFTLNGITLTPEQVQKVKNAPVYKPSRPTITFHYTSSMGHPTWLKGYRGVVFLNDGLYAVESNDEKTIVLSDRINSNANYRPWHLEVVE